jgi:hypothetical protein
MPSQAVGCFAFRAYGGISPIDKRDKRVDLVADYLFSKDFLLTY